jgi:uncharacterized protein (TIGR03067 family)
MSTRVGLIVLSLFVLGFAPAPFPKHEKPLRDNPADLTGTWAFTALEINGVSQNNFRNFRIEMTRDRITFHTERRSDWTLVLNPSASPPSFTWGQGNQIHYAGSYRLLNGELTMIYGITNRLEDRATDFNKAPYKYVFRRIKGG